MNPTLSNARAGQFSPGTISDEHLIATLKKYFGYDSFRPLQEEIIRDVLKGKDIFALLATGGGKSLCYQLPAMLREGITLVISPLIALMKDQVDALQTAGIPATFLNSSLGQSEAARRLHGFVNGEYKLLYVAPERALLPGFTSELVKQPITLVAIDEAHCISEWGHDFRPEYRQLPNLIKLLPKASIMALTATAAARVRTDIIQHLGLRQPSVFVSSFNRPNLRYEVRAKSDTTKEIINLIKAKEEESGIIYCQSRKSTEQLAQNLTVAGIKALPYHAGLEDTVRTSTQEKFLRDEVQVICATVAFGMGINKSNVRFVYHFDLPKSMEGYFQETGRAGRDGLPSECILFFSGADVQKYQRFIDEKPDPREQELARMQLRQMVDLAESLCCRRKILLNYFGEAFDGNCGGCDNCDPPGELFDATLPVQKFLSCVYRIYEKSGFNVGLAHMADVLTGANTEKVRKLGHNELSTYGIGKDVPKAEWTRIGRELTEQGFVSKNDEKFGTIELTETGKEALRQRKPFFLRKPVQEHALSLAESQKTGGSKAPLFGDIECDPELFNKLRELRKEEADQRQVPAFVIFSDTSLRLMARSYPTTLEEFGKISGVGEKKLQEFGEKFTLAIGDYLTKHDRLDFKPVGLKTAGPRPHVISDSVRLSYSLFESTYSLERVAAERKLAVSTVCNHVAEAIEAGSFIDLRRILTSAELEEITEAFNHTGMALLKPVHEKLGGRYDYNILRLVLATLRRSLPNAPG